MANKGLDTTFVHFGIQKEDMNLIEALCPEHQLDFDWVKDDLLKEFHERKIPPPRFVSSRTETSKY